MAQTIPSPVLLTRPQAASERFAAELRAPVVISPVLETVWLETAPLEVPPDAVVFTSENGVTGFVRSQTWRGTAYCVGDRTAQAARDAGFEAQSASGDLDDLTALLGRTAKGARLIHARGRHVAGDLGAIAAPLVTYDQRAVALSDEACALLRGQSAVIVPLFSPRSARVFVEHLPPDTAAPLVVIAMSAAVAQACQNAGLPVTHVAKAPDGASMLRAIEAARD